MDLLQASIPVNNIAVGGPQQAAVASVKKSGLLSFATELWRTAQLARGYLGSKPPHSGLGLRIQSHSVGTPYLDAYGGSDMYPHKMRYLLYLSAYDILATSRRLGHFPPTYRLSSATYDI